LLNKEAESPSGT